MEYTVLHLRRLTFAHEAATSRHHQPSLRLLPTHKAKLVRPVAAFSWGSGSCRPTLGPALSIHLEMTKMGTCSVYAV